MKHLKWMSLMLALTACLFTFTACGDDDDDDNDDKTPESSLYVGTWKAYEMDILGLTFPIEYDAEDPTGYMELVFETGGKGTVKLWTDDGLERITVKWKSAGNKLIMENGNESEELTYDEKTQSLTWIKTMTDQYGQSATYRFKKY